MSPRWLARVALALLAAWLLGASALQSQVCSPSDTIRLTRQGAALWYLLVDGDTLRHQPGGPPRAFTSEGIAAAHGVALRALTRRTIEVHQTYRGRILGCMPTSPVDGRDTTAVPPAIDSLPPIISPEPTPQDTVAPDPGIPSARGVITCQPEALCTGDARASVGDSVVWMSESSTGAATRLSDFQGLQWGPRTLGFPAGAPHTRTWWIVAWSGATADTARVVWTVPVTVATTYPEAHLDSPPAQTGFTWLLIDPRIPGGLITYPGPDSTFTPRQECVTARLVAGLTIWQPTDTIGWSPRDGRSFGTVLASCPAVSP